MRESPDPWKHKLGSEALTEIWQLGYRSLEDLQNPFEYVLSNYLHAEKLTKHGISQSWRDEGLPERSGERRQKDRIAKTKAC